MTIREHPLLSQRDDADADPPDLPADPAEALAGDDELIREVFEHLGRNVADDRGWDTDDGS